MSAQPETGMGYQVATVVLKDGRQFNDVLIAGGVANRVGNESDIPFCDDDTQRLVVTHGANAPLRDWQFEVEESSVGVYRVTGRGASGQRVVITGTDPDALIAECRARAVALAHSRPNLYVDSTGCSVEILGRTGLRYREGERSMFVGSEVLAPPAGIAVYQSTVNRWESPHDTEELPPDARSRILANIVAILRAHCIDVDQL